MLYLFISFCSLFSVLCSLAAPFTFAQDLSPQEPIVVNGDKVEYYQEQKKVVGLGNISITYKDVLLTCDRITVYLDTREGIAEGNVKVTQKGAFLTGQRMNYNFDTKKGTIIDSNMVSAPFFGRSQEVDKLAQKEQYNLDRGSITTCDLDKPHYRVQARKLKIYIDDKVEAFHILLFAGNVPVLYLPYYCQPMEGGKNNFTFIYGKDDLWGYYLLTAYRYQMDGYNKGDILVDYRSKKGLAEGINHYYTTNGIGNIGSGAFKFYNIVENYKYLVYERTGPTIFRYRYQFRHKWEMEEQDTSAVIEFNRLSDKNFIHDYLYKEYEEIGFDTDTFASVITSKQDYSTELLVRKRFGKFQTVVERLPQFSINIPNYNIKYPTSIPKDKPNDNIKDTSSMPDDNMVATPFYWAALATGVYLNKTFDNFSASPLEPQKDLDCVRFDAYNKLSYAAKLLGSLSTTPYAAVQNTYYSRNRWGDTNEIRSVLGAGVNNSIKFYKIYNVRTDMLGLDINRLRHVITPTADYYFTGTPTISPENLVQYDGIDATAKANGINFGLENRLQTKKMSDGQMKSVDLATLQVSVPYVFRLKKNDPTAFINHTQRFTTVDMQLELIPYSWMRSLSRMTINTKNQAVRTLSIDLATDGGEKWSFGGGYRYEKEETGLSNTVTLDGMYKFNDKWRVRAYERFAIRKSFQEQQYTIYRDLHCWTAELTYSYRKGDEHNLWFIIRLKAFPNYPLGLKRTYSRPEFGSQGEGTNYGAIM